MKGDYFWEEIARKRQYEIEQDLKARGTTSLMIDGVEPSNKMPVEGTERL